MAAHGPVAGSAHAQTAVVLDPDSVSGKALADYLSSQGVRVVIARSLTQLRAMGMDDGPLASSTDLAFVDVSSTATAESTLRAMREMLPFTALVATTTYGNVETAIEALRIGACDYICKPFVEGELAFTIARAARQRALLDETRMLKERLAGTRAVRPKASGELPSAVVGDDPRMRSVATLVRAVAPSKTTVLMTGESGTGKSLIAHAIHVAGPRAAKPFVELSCGSIPETLLESELFGHVKGAFTGAHADKQGRFAAANGGTLFLDEINSASPAMQLKLLRVLQERVFEPVGSTTPIEADVRIILATNQPLEALVSAGTFRQDLYYRINVINIVLPPLRERASDVPTLAHAFLERFASELRRQIVGFEPAAMHALCAYAYPGNVRELQNLIERACVLAQGQTITLSDLPEHVAHPKARQPALGTQASSALQAFSPTPLAPASLAPASMAQHASPRRLQDALREPERELIEHALRTSNFNRAKASELLGINRSTLYKKMKALGMLEDRRLAG
jgi:DNA-binding NtrC family response regulator